MSQVKEPSADISQKEGEFVLKVDERKYQVEELINRINTLSSLLGPYSAPSNTGGSKDNEDCAETDMGNALVRLEHEIQEAQNKIER